MGKFCGGLEIFSWIHENICSKCSFKWYQIWSFKKYIINQVIVCVCVCVCVRCFTFYFLHRFFFLIFLLYTLLKHLEFAFTPYNHTMPQYKLVKNAKEIFAMFLLEIKYHSTWAGSTIPYHFIIIIIISFFGLWHLDFKFWGFWHIEY